MLLFGPFGLKSDQNGVEIRYAYLSEKMGQELKSDQNGVEIKIKKGGEPTSL